MRSSPVSASIVIPNTNPIKTLISSTSFLSGTGVTRVLNMAINRSFDVDLNNL